jgi:hypothetical protein
MDGVLDFDEGIGQLMDIIVETQAKTEQDFMILVGGMEGSGKTTLILDCVEDLDLKKNLETPISHVAFSIKEFAGALLKGGNGSTIVLDEGKELEAANWQSKEVKEFKKAITKIRKAGHVYFIAFPNPLSMTGYIKYDKAFAVFLVTKRGHVHVYSKEVFVNIIEKIKTPSIAGILAFKPNFKCTFSKYSGILKEAYDFKKDRAISAAKQEFGDAMGYYEGMEEDEGLVSVAVVAKMCKVSIGTMRRWVNEGTIIPARVLPGEEALFTRQQVKDFIKSMEEKALHYVEYRKNKLLKQNQQAPSDLSSEKK